MFLEISDPMAYHVALYIRLSKEDESEGLIKRLRLPTLRISSGASSRAGVAAAPRMVVRVPLSTPCCWVLSPLR